MIPARRLADCLSLDAATALTGGKGGRADRCGGPEPASRTACGHGATGRDGAAFADAGSGSQENLVRRFSSRSFGRANLSGLILAGLVGLLSALLIALFAAGTARAEYARALISSTDRELRSVVVEAAGVSDLPAQSAPEAHRQAALADAKRKALIAARAFLEKEAREKRLTTPYRFVRVEGTAEEEAVFVLESREGRFHPPGGAAGADKPAVRIKAEVVYVVARDAKTVSASSDARLSSQAAPAQAGGQAASPPATGQAASGKSAEPPALPLAKPGRPMAEPAGKPNDFKKNLEEMTDALKKRMDGGGN